MNIRSTIFFILIIFVTSLSVWGASVPPYSEIRNCRCDQKVQTHFFKDAKNKSEIQISKTICICADDKKEVTAVCPTKKRSLKKFIKCAQDNSISTETSPIESTDLPSNPEGSAHETQTR